MPDETWKARLDHHPDRDGTLLQDAQKDINRRDRSGHRMTEIDSAALARLAFWGKNMVAIRDGRMEWPGFSYSEAEWERMRALAAAVTNAAFGKYILVNTVAFLAIAAAAIAGIFLPLATVLFPVPAETSALKFALLLAGCALLIISVGLQISLRIATAAAADATMRSQLVAAPGDNALSSKVSRQINRITLIMSGLLVPGIVIWVAYDIDGGPIVTALKWLAAALMAVSMATGLRRQKTKQ